MSGRVRRAKRGTPRHPTRLSDPRAASTSVKDGDLTTPMELNDFMSQLGMVMRLPTRDVQVLPDEPVAPKTRTVARSLPLLPTLATAVVLAYAIVTAWPTPAATVPIEVVGTWVTADARYAGRRFELTGTTIRHATGAEDPILAAQERRAGDTLSVRLTYGEPGSTADLSLAWIRSPREHLILQNPVGVMWTRATAGDTLAPPVGPDSAGPVAPDTSGPVATVPPPR